jgi:hypothetical protein
MISKIFSVWNNYVPTKFIHLDFMLDFFRKYSASTNLDDDKNNWFAWATFCLYSVVVNLGVVAVLVKCATVVLKHV